LPNLSIRVQGPTSQGSAWTRSGRHRCREPMAVRVDSA